jgi:uncharacterized protein YkwD
MTTHLRALARRFGVVVVLPVLIGSALLVSAPSAPSAEAAVAAPTAAQVAAFEARVIQLINVTRATNHRVRLVASPCPDRYAESWASYMARTWRFAHQSLTPMLRACSATLATENLARGYTSADATYVAWMRSPGHKANILNARLTRIGVAAVYARGQWTVVADFTRS